MSAVPAFEMYYATSSAMDKKQASFYRKWKDAWLRGEVHPVGGFVSYLFAYMHEVHASGRDRHLPSTVDVGRGASVTVSTSSFGVPTGVSSLGQVPRVVRELERLDAAFGGEYPKFRWYCRYNIAQYWAMAGDFERSANFMPPPQLGKTARLNVNTVLNYRCEAGQSVTSGDLLSSGAGRLTAYGKERIEQVAGALDELIDEADDPNSIAALVRQLWTTAPVYPQEFLNGSLISSGRTYDYRDIVGHPSFVERAKVVIRDAENALRRSEGIPAVGEGWVGETRLFRELEAALPDLLVVQHARPAWLRGQHLDVFVPDAGVAFEYQGIQHFEPVEFFGGEEGFRRTVERDRRKARRCRREGIVLVPVVAGYELAELVEVVRSELGSR